MAEMKPSQWNLHLSPTALKWCAIRLAETWEAAIEVNDDKRNKLIEARSADEGHSRGDAVQLFWLCAEHTLLRESMVKRKWVSSSKYQLCDADSESTSHVLFQCPALAGAREVFWEKRVSKWPCWDQNGPPHRRWGWSKCFCECHRIGSQCIGRPLGVLPPLKE